jgi:hypothetical protein
LQRYIGDVSKSSTLAKRNCTHRIYMPEAKAHASGHSHAQRRSQEQIPSLSHFGSRFHQRFGDEGVKPQNSKKHFKTARPQDS